MRKKDLEEYQEKYGNVPKNFFERFTYLLDSIKLSKKDIDKLQGAVRKLLKAKWQELDFVFYIMPKATPRARYSGRTRVFYVKNASDNSALFKKFIDESEDDYGIITTPTKLLCDLYLPMPKMNRMETILAELKLIRPVVKPDWDNAGKTYSDMVQKHLLLDDSLVIDGRVRKFYSLRPRVEVKFKFMTKYDSKFNKKKIESWKFYKDLEEKIVERDSIL